MEEVEFELGSNDEDIFHKVLEFMIKTNQCPNCGTSEKIICLADGNRTPWESAICPECDCLFGFETTEGTPCFHATEIEYASEEEFNEIFTERKEPMSIEKYADFVKKMLIGE